MPKYHVFENGLLSFPNDLADFQAAITRFREAVAMTAGRPRCVVTLRKRHGSRRLRRFET
jgi:hypothetical protein